MKRIVSPSDVAHFFVNRTQHEAYNSGRTFYFIGDSIYSYGSHFCIAKHFKGALLFTTRSYSMTTARHISTVRMAARHLNIVYCPFPNGGDAENFGYWIKQLKELASKLGRARKKERWLSEIISLTDQIKECASVRDWEIPTEALDLMITGDDNEKVLLFAEAMKELEDQRRKERLLAHENEVEKFRNFKVDRIYTQAKDIDYLRFSIDEGFKTSQGVTMSKEEGLTLYAAIKSNRLKQGDRVLYYRVRKIDAKELVVGCHRILLTEIERVIESNRNLLFPRQS